MIYQDILWWTLPHLRNVATRSWWRRLRDRSTYYETELVHNIPVLICEPVFTEADISFLKVHAASYIRECNNRISPLYQAQVKRLESLCVIAPDSFKFELQKKPAE